MRIVYFLHVLNAQALIITQFFQLNIISDDFGLIGHCNTWRTAFVQHKAHDFG